MRIDIKTNFPEVQRALKDLRADVAGKALVSAVNKTIEQARTQMVREIIGEYRVTSAYVRERMRLRRASFRAGAFGVTAELSAGGGRKGRSANLINFVSKAQRDAGGAKRRKDGTRGQLKFQVRKAGGKQVITGAFIGNKGRTVFIRTGSARLPIKAVQTIDVPQMFNQRRINAQVVNAIKTRFPTIFEREARYYLSRFNGT
jgi:hypothetical protein